jgi:glycosyltransferase involved in cell wall biosynthesis
MRVLVVADAVLRVPPVKYGGAERVIASLCDGFVERGHEVVLMAAEGSTASGRLVVHRPCDNASYLSRAFRKIWFQPLSISAVRSCDVVLNSGRVDYLHAVLASRVPIAARFGNPIDQPSVDFLVRRRAGADLRLVSISDSQRRGIMGGHWDTIYNAVDTTLYRPAGPVGEHLAFVGRLTPEKGIDIAIRVARRSGRPLRIAGPESDPGFFKHAVRPYLGADVEYLGVLDGAGVSTLMASSVATLFPIRWREPFGLVMAESLACGTPVIALRTGPVPEVIRSGETGFICDSEDQMVASVVRVGEISREVCRRDAEVRFSNGRMVTDYLRILEDLAGGTT